MPDRRPNEDLDMLHQRPTRLIQTHVFKYTIFLYKFLLIYSGITLIRHDGLRLGIFVSL